MRLPAYVTLAGALACSKPPTEATLESAQLRAHFTFHPYRLEVRRRLDDRVVLSSAGGPRATQDTPEFISQLLKGWDGYRAKEAPWTLATEEATLLESSATTLKLGFGEAFTLAAAVDGPRLKLTVRSLVPGLNKTALPFVFQTDEHVFGAGERYATFDHRGLSLYNWAEEAGLGGGEQDPHSKDNPFPNGPSMTYFPMPFFHSSAGYAASLDTTRRTELDFGSVEPGVFRGVVNGTELPMTVYVAEPLKALDVWTQDTGRPPEPAPWVWGPRRRIGRSDVVDGMPEWQAMRERKLPLTACDDAMHFLPALSHLGVESELRTWTQTLHANGFKAIGYNNPYLASDKPNSAADYALGRDAGYFERQPGGEPATTQFFSGAPVTISAIDLTNPQAVKWFEGLLQRGVDLGYDGWMHDFGEYVARSSKFFDGRRGDEMHNAFPVLSAKAAHDFWQRVRPNDYLFFVRSGFTGTQAFAPAVWGGDPETSFDDTQGLPAALRGGLNLALSGVPYWGSDMGGFKCLTEAPRDKELLVRWYAVGALSPIMMDQNACVSALGARTKWTLWSDQQTQDVYRVMAGLHTRLAPYFRILAREAKATGVPLMRPPFLLHPSEPLAWATDDTFFLGPSLFAAPVVRRGVTTRRLWLPPGKYVEWFGHTVHDGGGMVELPAPFERVPLFLKTGQLVPLLDADVQTLAPATLPGVVTEAARDGVLDVRVALEPGQRATLTMVDGTLLEAQRGTAAGTGSGLTEVPAAMMASCEGCFAKEGARTLINSRQVEFEDLKLSSSHQARRIRWEIFRP